MKGIHKMNKTAFSVAAAAVAVAAVAVDALADEEMRLTVPSKMGDREVVQFERGGAWWDTRNIGAATTNDFGYYFLCGNDKGFIYRGEDDVVEVGTDRKVDGRELDGWMKNKKLEDLRAEGWISEDNTLLPEHDSATINLGEGWRMPTCA